MYRYDRSRAQRKDSRSDTSEIPEIVSVQRAGLSTLGVNIHSSGSGTLTGRRVSRWLGQINISLGISGEYLGSKSRGTPVCGIPSLGIPASEASSSQPEGRLLLLGHHCRMTLGDASPAWSSHVISGGDRCPVGQPYLSIAEPANAPPLALLEHSRVRSTQEATTCTARSPKLRHRHACHDET